jgi:hypothetical protein
MKTVRVPAELAAAIHEYLVSRPMREVEALVGALRRCEPITRRSSPATAPDKSANGSGKNTSRTMDSDAG